MRIFSTKWPNNTRENSSVVIEEKIKESEKKKGSEGTK